MAKPIKDVDLLDLPGTVLESPRQAGVRYQLQEPIGEGAQGVVFSARRQGPGADEKVVIKVLRPRAVRDLGGLAATAIAKEVGALQRLSDGVAASPYVVRFLDTGTLGIRDNALALPWLAVEYVDGGAEGTTLRSRVATSLAQTEKAFDVRRARLVVKCMALGLSAIHAADVIHRDVNPSNVLCCGTGETESFKISDFGLARVSSAATYGNVLLGTPGYTAPEQSFPEKVGVGTYSDVFGLACCLYFVLTGEAYFAASNIPETLVAVYSPTRRSILEARGLSEELRARSETCLVIDQWLARATHSDPRHRPQSAAEFGSVQERFELP